MTDRQRLIEELLQKKLRSRTSSQGISQRPDQATFPLSFTQERIWFLEQLDPQSPVYNRPLALQLTGPLHVPILACALSEIVRRHEVLRARFSNIGGRPFQSITASHPLVLPVKDLSTFAVDERESQARRLVQQEAQRSFDLTQDALIRTILLRLEAQHHLLLLVFHHIAFDTWSANVFIRELSVLYEAFATGQASPLSELPIQYADFAHWQRENLQTKGIAAQLTYWKQQLTGAPPLLNLPFDHPRPAKQRHRGNCHTQALPVSLVTSLQTLVQKENVTFYMLLLAALNVLIYRYTNQEDIVIGSPVAGRTQVETEGLIGCFLNTLALRTDVSGDPTFQQLLQRVRKLTLEAYSHQALPFEKLVEVLQPERNLKHTPIFHILFNLENFPDQPEGKHDLCIKEFEFDRGIAQFDLTLEVIKKSTQLTCLFNYNSDLFEPSTITRMAGHFQVLLEGIAANPGQRLSDLPLLTEAERHQILVEWNDTRTDYPKELCIHQLFEMQVERTPDAIAVVFEDQQLTYDELNSKANQLAHYLQKKGVGPEVPVGICVERSLDMLIGLFGILKAGGVYVPLDPSYPRERLAFMLKDSQAHLLITQKRVTQDIKNCEIADDSIIYLDSNQSTISQENGINPVYKLLPENLAYIIYTSGSTGKPKGVQISHHSLTNLFHFMRQQSDIIEQKTFLAATTISFDIAALELYLFLLIGGTVVIATREKSFDGFRLIQTIQNSGATMMHATPVSWRILLSAGWKKPAHFISLCGGEALPWGLAKALLKRSDVLWNLYGPTETTLFSTGHRMTKQSTNQFATTQIVPIGRPLSNTQIYILDQQLHPVPIGVAGELYIGGDGLARGYFNRPELTAERFIPNHYSTIPGSRLYKTGDLTRYLSDGTLEFLGRLDHQVKIRGFRVELGEIESELKQHPAVREAAVLVREDLPDHKRLIAYIVPDQATPSLTRDLRNFLIKKLPDYMIPSVFMLLKALPLTPNAKINRRALPVPDTTRPALEKEFVSPTTPCEEKLARIWCDVLQLDQVGVHDNFFALGGHSLLAAQIISQINRTFGIEVPLRCLFDTPTIAGLSGKVAQQKQIQNIVTTFPEIIPQPEQRFQPFPLTDIQEAYWVGRTAFFELGNIAPHSYVEIDSMNLNVERLTLAWQRLIERHDMLRAIILADGRQQILEHVPMYQIAVVDLGGCDQQTIDAELATVRREMSHQVFRPDEWPLFDIRISRVDRQHYRIHLSFDALFSDAWSRVLLFKEWAQLYQQPDKALVPLELSFRDYVHAERALRDSELYQQARTYWRERCASLSAAPELPLARSPETIPQPRFVRRSATLDVKLWQCLKHQAVQAGVTPSGLLLATFSEVLRMWSKSSHFTLNLTLFHRLPLHPQINEILGNFTSLTLVEVNNSDAKTFEERARQLQQQLWDDLDHRYISGVQVLRELAKRQGSAPYARMPIVFTSTLNHDVQDVASLSHWLEETVYHISQTPQVWLDHVVTEKRGTLAFSWFVVDTLFPQGLIETVFAVYCKLLRRLATEDSLWQEDWINIAKTLVPEDQLTQRLSINATNVPVSDHLLHLLFAAQVCQSPHQPAVKAYNHTLTYQQLFSRANQIGHRLHQLGVRPNTLVAIVMEKGWEQIPAVLGVLASGAAYLPIDAHIPQERLWFLLADGQVEIVLTQPYFERTIDWPENIQRLVVDEGNRAFQMMDARPLPPQQEPGDLAYVIYTSGSTGQPKGVMIDHRGAVNTILDINRRFGVNDKDRVLALSALSFDLSVYDIFGTLAAGGTIILPHPADTQNPASWVALIVQEQVTIWNSVPALMELLVEYASGRNRRLSPSLRVVLLSGDWIPVTLPDHLRTLTEDVQIMSLGGATEASIWSILYPIEAVDPAWTSIPYGKPMANQQFHVLNEELLPCPVWVPGQLYIGGLGLAKGYWRNEEKTAASFITHPRTGERLYRAGDLGRYLPDGNIEFLGREDLQVKIQGFRVELGEIEAALHQHPMIRTAVVTATGEPRGEKHLAAYTVPMAGSTPGPVDLRHFLTQKLPEYMVPATYISLDELPLTPNGKIDRQALPVPTAPSGTIPHQLSQEDSTFTSQITQLVTQILGVNDLAPHTNFLTLGATSVDMIRIINILDQELDFRPEMNAFYRQPTVEWLVQAYEQHTVPQTSFPRERSQPPISVITSLENSLPLILAPADRDAFKRTQPGLRTIDHEAMAVQLLAPEAEEVVKQQYTRRRSYRQFLPEPVPFAQFSRLLSCLTQQELDGAPKYLYASAGGLYPVQTYLALQAGGVETLSSGIYYYHPATHRVVLISTDTGAWRDIYDPFVNRPIFEQVAFAIFLIAQCRAIVPMYGDQSLHFATLEAGLMTQLLEMTAPAYGIGLCQIGNVDFERIRPLFALDKEHIYIHSLLGGLIDPCQNSQWQPFQHSQSLRLEEEYEEGEI